ncbi:MAG: hypothetical protein ACMV1B_02925, partial [Prevotella sp.]
MAEGLAYSSMFNPTQYRVDNSTTKFGFSTDYNVDDALKASQFDFSGVKVPSAEAVSKIDYSKVSPVVTDTEYGGLVQAGNSVSKPTAAANSLAYDFYKPTQTELVGVADSYNKLGGVQGTGMDFKTWAGTQGISTTSQDNGMFDWLGSDNMK